MARPLTTAGLALCLAGVSFAAGTHVGAGSPRVGGVSSVETAGVRVAPSGKARVRVLSTPDAQAFVGVLEMDAGAKVPSHRDTDDEFVFVLEGGGALFLDGTRYDIKPGDLVTMPAHAEVRFEALESGPTRVLQVFAPADSKKKYDGWAKQEAP
jgi:quercetin dioxygenase-like cupin family protein